jgi:hypothetical protein
VPGPVALANGGRAADDWLALLTRADSATGLTFPEPRSSLLKRVLSKAAPGSYIQVVSPSPLLLNRDNPAEFPSKEIP